MLSTYYEKVLEPREMVDIHGINNLIWRDEDVNRMEIFLHYKSKKEKRKNSHDPQKCILGQQVNVIVHTIPLVQLNDVCSYGVPNLPVTVR